MDEAQNAPAALGIAEFDPMIDEGSLEWIQVLPAYRGRGLGQQIVFELLNLLHGKAAFTTVAGQVDNPTYPERLYRRCGFDGDDYWWVLRK
jgi:GNAT superfamily N-acetyltransferase